MASHTIVPKYCKKCVIFVQVICIVQINVSLILNIVKRFKSHVGQRELHMIYATIIKAVGTTNHPKTIHV